MREINNLDDITMARIDKGNDGLHLTLSTLRASPLTSKIVWR